MNETHQENCVPSRVQGHKAGTRHRMFQFNRLANDSVIPQDGFVEGCNELLGIGVPNNQDNKYEQLAREE